MSPPNQSHDGDSQNQTKIAGDTRATGLTSRRNVLKATGTAGAAAFLSSVVASGDDSGSSSGDTITVESTPETVDWGAYDPDMTP